jgi:lambda repressor-like predicted transcriptional regulator
MNKKAFAKVLASIPEAVERGHLIRARLKSLGVEPGDIARELGVSTSAVTHAIKDDGKYTRIQQMVADAIGMDLAAVFPRSHGRKRAA